MTVLNIYSLDDTENQNVIACLPEGKHVIGRGDLLKVTDKRVSRKHAVIEVSNDKISLTSVHVNPCFFKAAKGKTLSVISQNQESELNDGDQFALLPESCWFKVKIKREKETSVGNITEVSGKRTYDNNSEENFINMDSKRARLSTASHEISISNADNSATTSSITLEFTNRHQENEELGTQELENNVEGHTSPNLTDTGIIKNENGDEDVNSELKENPRGNKDASPNTSHNALEDNPNNASHTVHNTNLPNQEIKEEPLTNNDEELERLVEANTLENEITSGNSPVSNEQPTIKRENNDNDNQSKASGSGSGAKKVRRERCWYRDRCFRKNPNHREAFAHPGDQDYESDPDDDRPDCPYGASCYRKNIDHRTEYKHVGKPAPKPRPRLTSPNSPGSPTTQNQPQNKKKPRNAASKKPKQQYDYDSSQDDYDLDDPFINDASSDDFQPSDGGIDSDSSDLEDSQDVEESQERRRMMNEAKKFTKKKK